MNHDFVLREPLVFCSARSWSVAADDPGISSFDGALHWEGGKPTLILLVPRDDAEPALHRDRRLLPVPFRQRL